MPETNISSAVIGDNKSVFDSDANKFSVDSATTDAATGIGETEYLNSKAAQWLGYYKTIPELKAAIDAKATWTVGKGVKASIGNTFVMDTIRGFGVDTFNTILENCIRSYHIYGDSFCEIIRNQDGELINLKPLDPGTIKIIANEKGLIDRYEQTTKYPQAGIMNKVKNFIGMRRKNTFKQNKIFHLAKNRIADEIHGTSIIPAMEWIILARNEAMEDYRKLLHRNVYPVRIWECDTDNTAKLATLKAKAAEAKYSGEDLFIPKGAMQTAVAGIATNSILDSKAWIEQLNKYFFEACGTPKIVIGNAADFTESAVKIVYLAWEQTIEEEQLYIEEQVAAQLGMEIELTFPATLQNELLSDTAKDGTLQQNMNQPSQTQITPGEKP